MLKICNKRKGEKCLIISVKTFIFLFFISLTTNAIGQETYEVVSTSRLNVRSKPSTNSSIIGTLNPHEQVDVYSIIDSWAKISYKSRMAYVSSKYIRKIEIKENIPVVVERQEENNPITSETKETEISEVIYNEPTKKDNIGIDFVPSIYGGFTNFVSDNASPKGNIGFGADFAFQFIANRPIGFIPKDYYMEASLGYSLKGSGAFPLHYIIMKLSPIGYRYMISDFMLLSKIGVYTGYTFSTIETNSHSFDTNIDIGILCEIGIEYKRVGVGLSYEQGFANVCNSNLRLNNQCVFLNLSYRLFNLK